jgi:transcriptional regulator with XRE-family HTH domain
MTAAELRSLIENAESTQTAVADQIGVDRRTVNRWCRGAVFIPQRVAMLLRTLLIPKK